MGLSLREKELEPSTELSVVKICREAVFMFVRRVLTNRADRKRGGKTTEGMDRPGAVESREKWEKLVVK